MEKTNDINITSMKKLISPKNLKKEFPLTAQASKTVAVTRQTIGEVITGGSEKLIGIVGPCSIHDQASALDYARRLKSLSDKVSSKILLVMRVYFEKPRTSVGWRGFIVDPSLDGSHEIERGLREARHLLLQIAEMGLPAATEVLDPIVPQYLSDLISWAAIGARTTESQTHRDITSGLSMPVGFKNGTDGNLDIAVNAIAASREPKSFIGIDQEGQTCILTTKGNRFAHVILRGGKHGPNYGPSEVDKAEGLLRKHQLPPFIMVDCSHANSGKDPFKQPQVLKSIIDQYVEGRKSLIGFMVESHIGGGSQPIAPLPQLQYGVSITDGCLGWEATEQAILEAYARLGGQ